MKTYTFETANQILKKALCLFLHQNQIDYTVDLIRDALWHFELNLDPYELSMVKDFFVNA